DVPTGDGYAGKSALSAIESTLILARSGLSGGYGAPGAMNYDYQSPPAGGTGGTAIVLEQSQLLLMGCCNEGLRRGDGGQGGFDWDGNVGRGGDGGPGISGSRATVSAVSLEGGAGGGGYPNGDPGPPFRGDVSFLDDALPTLDVPNEVVIGQSFDVT